MDASNVDDYYLIALQIFEHCGVESSGSLRVDALMSKLSPFINTNKAEFSQLKNLLDPDEENPVVNVKNLASSLNKCCESKDSKIDLDESFNLMCSKAPQDSDSGISSDGFQILEELQCELREKCRLSQQLRSQLDYSERQHEEALASLTAERDALKAHLNILREENASLMGVREEYDDVCEQLRNSERALSDARRELNAQARRLQHQQHLAAADDSAKTTLQELLSKSKEECHRINEMYATRQSALLEETEALRTERSDLAARLQDQEEFLQQLIKEKVLLEMELKDVLNKSNQTHLRMDRSIDVSYTEDQMLTALDSLNSDTRFSQEHRLLDEESFLNALKNQDQGRHTNVSLFDEIRFSFGTSASRNDFTDHDSSCRFKDLDKSLIDNETQTDDFVLYINSNTGQNNIETQTCYEYKQESTNESNICIESKCMECEKLKSHIENLESRFKRTQSALEETVSQIDKYEDDLNVLQKLLDDGDGRNSFLQVAVDSLQSKIMLLEAACASQRNVIENLSCEMCCTHSQTDSDVVSVSTQAELPCVDCKKHVSVKNRGIRGYFWDRVRSLFQVAAVACFCVALWVLYGAWTGRARCKPTADLLDFFLRVDQLPDVPM